MMSSLLDLAVFPGNQGGPLMHIMPQRQLRLVKRYKMNSLRTLYNYKKNAKAMAELSLKEGTISFQEVQTTT
jgi:glycine hydroxymethyltransferase